MKENYSDINKKHGSRLASHCSKDRNNWGLVFHRLADDSWWLQHPVLFAPDPSCCSSLAWQPPHWLLQIQLHIAPLLESCTMDSSQSNWRSFSSKRSKTFHNWLYLLFKHLKGNIKTCSRVQQQVSKLFVCWLKKWYNRNSTLFHSEVNHSPALPL